jgi:hemerythrin-like domain-containing protein
VPVDTSDMLAVHAVLRRAFGDAGALLGTVEVGDDDRAALVASYFANALALLQTHHDAEDVLLLPRLMERVADAVPVAHVAGQHGGLDPVLQAVERRLTDWAGSPTVQRARSLSAAFSALSQALDRHLDDEESMVLPLAAEHLTADEWARLPAYAMAHFTGDRPWLILGLIRAEMTEQHAAEHLAAMPVPAQEFWRTVGSPQYEAFVATLFG